MVDLHRPIHGGRIDTLCNVTASAVAWLIAGRDLAPAFSDAWFEAPEGTGPNDQSRLIAYGTFDADSGIFEDEHVLLALVRDGKTLLLDSHWAEGRRLTVRTLVDAVPQPENAQVARHILLPSSGSRLAI
jgi:hypothetical protein